MYYSSVVFVLLPGTPTFVGSKRDWGREVRCRRAEGSSLPLLPVHRRPHEVEGHSDLVQRAP